jgi:uncharacterized protein with HEPN domain
VTRSDQQRFADIVAAINRCQQYAPYLHSEDHSAMAYDAVLRNLAVIGEAVRSLSDETRARIPDAPWPRSPACATWSVHEYFRVNPDLVLDIVENQLSPLKKQVEQL